MLLRESVSRYAVIDLNVPLHKGDSIRIVGHTTNFKQDIESMEINHETVTAAYPGDDLAIKVLGRVRSGDRVYKLPAE